MRFSRFITCLASAGGAAALTVSPTAGADAIDDAWPYGGIISLYMPGNNEAGSATNSGQDTFGPFAHTYYDAVATHTAYGTDEWYTAHHDIYVIPDFYNEDRTEVTGLLDGSADYPSVGTVYDETDLFPIHSPIGTINLFQNISVNDPELGFADQFLFPGFINTFLSDDAGIKDVGNFFGLQFTLFDIPFTASGADASDDGFAQLLTELGGSP